MARKDQYKSDLIHTLGTRLDFVRSLLNDLERDVQGFTSDVEEIDAQFSKVWMRADEYFRAFPFASASGVGSASFRSPFDKPRLPIMRELVDLAKQLEKVTDGEIDIEDDVLSLTAYFSRIQRRAESAQEELEEINDYYDGDIPFDVVGNAVDGPISDIEYDIDIVDGLISDIEADLRH
jgi:hypothetical protein